MKKLIFSLLLASGVVANAETVTTYASGGAYNTTNVILSAPYKVETITVQNATATNIPIVFMDSWSVRQLTTNSAYATTLTYTTNIQAASISAWPVAWWTNSAGVVQSNTYMTNMSLLYTVQSNYVATTSNSYPTVLSATVPANTTVVYPIGIVVQNGLVIKTNMHDLIVTTVYSAPR